MDQSFIYADTDKFEFEHSQAYIDDKYRYWPELEQLVQQCLEINPNKRPHLNEILYATRIGLEDWERQTMPVSGLNVPPPLTWPWIQEDFAIGQDVPKHWRWYRHHRPGHDDSSSGDDEPPPRKRPRSDDESSSAASRDMSDSEGYRPSEDRTVRMRGGKRVRVSMERKMPSAGRGYMKRREYGWLKTGNRW